MNAKHCGASVSEGVVVVCKRRRGVGRLSEYVLVSCTDGLGTRLSLSGRID